MKQVPNAVNVQLSAEVEKRVFELLAGITDQLASLKSEVNGLTKRLDRLEGVESPQAEEAAELPQFEEVSTEAPEAPEAPAGDSSTFIQKAAAIAEGLIPSESGPWLGRGPARRAAYARLLHLVENQENTGFFGRLWNRFRLGLPKTWQGAVLLGTAVVGIPLMAWFTGGVAWAALVGGGHFAVQMGLCTAEGYVAMRP